MSEASSAKAPQSMWLSKFRILCVVPRPGAPLIKRRIYPSVNGDQCNGLKD